MIKKAVLLTTVAPFLMVFSDYSHAIPVHEQYSDYHASAQDIINMNNDLSSTSCSLQRWPQPDNGTLRRFRNPFGIDWPSTTAKMDAYVPYRHDIEDGHSNPRFWGYTMQCPDGVNSGDVFRDTFPDRISPNFPLSDSQCQDRVGGSGSFTVSSMSNDGSYTVLGGACNIVSSGNLSEFCYGDPLTCHSESWVASTTGSPPSMNRKDMENYSPSDFYPPFFLNELPGACASNSSCVTIGDKSYLVDWDNAPDYFEYVGSDGNTYSKPGSGGGSGGDNGGDTGGGDPTDPTNPTDPGGNDGGDSGGSDGGNDAGDGSGGSSGGGSSGGGSTVPEFEFDESGIIEAIRSSGQSNRNAIDALSNDVTGSINNQTNELNTTINTEASRLITETDRQTDRVTTAITSQTQSVQHTLDNQTRSLNSTLEGLQSSLVDALGNIQVRFSGGGGSGGGSSEGGGDGEGDEEGDGIDGLLDSLIDKLASRFTEEVGDGDDLFNTSGMDETLDGLGEQQEQYNQDVHDLMDEIGDGSSSGIADQVTSRLPSLPSGSCTPLEFGPIEISCRPFDLIKSWLTWIIYFWTIVSIVDTFFRSGQRTA